MRWRDVLLLAASLALLPLALGGDRAASFGPTVKPGVRALDLLRQAGIECGTFDGQYTCRYVRGGTQHGKNAPIVPAPRSEPTPDGLPSDQYATPPTPGTWSTEATPNAMPDAGSGCQGGMVGTPPNCRCPPSSELLGGNCVRYTALTCSNGLASDALPQACAGIEEKLSCRLRDDGLKDCCCVIYDKF